MADDGQAGEADGSKATDANSVTGSGGGCVTGPLRAAWDPHKKRLAAEDPRHPTNIRVHRALSWVEAAEQQGPEADDERLLFHWIAFNSLYSRWDEHRLEPCADRESYETFVKRTLRLDSRGVVADVLTTHKPLVLKLLDNSFLRRSFWQHPSMERARRRTRHRQDAQQLYAAGRHGDLLLDALSPVYFLRCQLVHGAATRGSRMNRESLRHADALLAWVVPALLAVVIDEGMDQDWGPICYPPQD